MSELEKKVLSDEELENVNGGRDIYVDHGPVETVDPGIVVDPGIDPTNNK